MKTLLDPKEIFMNVRTYGGNAVTEYLVKIGADKLSFAIVMKSEVFIWILSAPKYQETPLGIIQMKYGSTREKIPPAPEPIKIGMNIKPETPKCKDGYDHSNALVWTPEKGWYLIDVERIPKYSFSDDSGMAPWEAERTFKIEDNKIKCPRGFQEFRPMAEEEDTDEE